MLVPPMCALAMSTSGPVKATCERSLARVLGLGVGLDGAHRYLAGSPGATVRTALTEPFLKRLQKLAAGGDEDELFAVEEY